MSQLLRIEPLDVLHLRGNGLFGAAGSYGGAQMPPWPSVGAGALRSSLLADHPAGLPPVGAVQWTPDGDLGEVLGSLARPGTFRLGFWGLGRRLGSEFQLLISAPSDVVFVEGDMGSQASLLQPSRPGRVRGSFQLPLVATMKASSRGKPKSGMWLDQKGWQSYLRGELPAVQHCFHALSLWRSEVRVGVGLDIRRRSAADGKLFSTEAVSFCHGVGLAAIVAGADGLFQHPRLIRIGGDGRAARVEPISGSVPEPDWTSLRAGFKIALLSPGLFEGGWMPPAVRAEGEDLIFRFNGVRARLVCASVPRYHVISGWDLLNWRPKPAQRTVPAGSVYWFDHIEGDPAALRPLLEDGWWHPVPQTSDRYDFTDRQRWAEGFNAVTIAAWKQQNAPE